MNSVRRSSGRIGNARRGNARRSSGGFILAATLWALAALALLAAYVADVVEADVDRAILARRSLESELERRGTENTLIYLFATGRMNYRGLILEEEQRFSDGLSDDESLPDHGDGELRTSGVVYAGLGGARFSLQDEGGLASVNVPRFRLFRAALAHVGVAADDVERIVARVEDYVDTDGDLTLNGAEAHDYRENGMPPPLDWIMSSPPELKRVLGVGELLTPAQWRRLRPLLTVRPVLGYNFNMMRPEILAALLDLDERGIQGVLEEREKQSISRLSQIAMLSGRHLDVDPTELRELPSRFVRISVWHEGDASRTLAGVALTPFGESAPWRKDYRYSEAMTVHDDSVTPGEPPLQAATTLFR